jgi:DNA/RNA endonuclease YhcR with UshA esterase domain
MKFFSPLIVITLLSAATTTVYAADAIPAGDVSKHIGETVTVQGKVAEIKTLKNGEAFLRIGAAYPDQLFTDYIASLKTVADEAWLKSLSGKTVRIHGRTDLYAGKPEIKITSPDQVRAIQ